MEKKVTLVFGLLLTMLVPFAMMDAYATPTIFGLAHTGPTGPSTLYSIDSVTGVGTPIGPTGFLRCSGMDTDAFGTVFATCTRTDSTPVLVTIDTLTGAATEVGTTGINPNISDINFRGGDDALFAFDAIFTDHTLYTLSTASGAATLVGSTGLVSDGGNGIAFSPSDILHHIARDTGFHTLDQTFGTASAGASMIYPAGFLGGSIKAMDTDLATGTLYAIAKDDAGGGGTNSEWLATIDVGTLTVTIIGLTAEDMDAITVINFVAIGGTYIPIDQSALLLAGVQSVSMWMIPVVIAGVGIGVFVIKRRN